MSLANKIVVGLVGLTVMAVVFGAMIPIMGEVTSAETTFTNDGYYRMSETDKETVIVWDTATDPDILTINDYEYKLSDLGLSNMYSYSIAFSDDFIMRYYPQGTNSNIQFWGSSYTGQGMGANTGNVLTVTINTSGITVQKTGASDATVAHTGDYFIMDLNGDMTMKKMTTPAYILPDSSIVYAGGINNYASGSPGGMYFEGALDDYTFSPMRANVEVTNIETTYTEVSDYLGLDKLDKITFTTTWTKQDETTETIDQTYSYFLVPYEVTAEKAIHPDGPTTAILNMLPLIVGAGLVLGAIAFMIVKKK